MQKHFLIFLFSAFVVMMSSCNKQQMKSQSENVSTVHLSKGGGFTGIYNGYSITSQGQLVSWQQTAAGEKDVQATDKVKAKKVKPFFQQIETFIETDLESPGNMTTKLVLQRPDTTVTWLWNAENTDTEPTAELNELYLSMWQFCQKNID